MHDNESLHNADQVSMLRILDAAANRTLEGIRVVEDIVRFGRDDRHLTECLKDLRHKVGSTVTSMLSADRTRARDTLADVGTTIKTDDELSRSNLNEIVSANLHRAQEGLRTLAEVAKAVTPEAAQVLESARYELYTIEKAVINTDRNLQQLENTRLYVLIDGQSRPAEFDTLVRRLMSSAVDAIQLRDKNLDDRTLLARAKQLVQITKSKTSNNDKSATLAIINDRADIAAAADADGVHVGQDELPVTAARSILGTDRLIGVSTHNIDQARQAVLEGADYIGVGPTFPSQTKNFDDFPGLTLVQQVASEIRLPAFAIGGINAKNVNEVIQAGLTRVAVSAAVAKADDPATAANRLRELLTS